MRIYVLIVVALVAGCSNGTDAIDASNQNAESAAQALASVHTSSTDSHFPIVVAGAAALPGATVDSAQSASSESAPSEQSASTDNSSTANPDVGAALPESESTSTDNNETDSSTDTGSENTDTTNESASTPTDSDSEATDAPAATSNNEGGSTTEGGAQSSTEQNSGSNNETEEQGSQSENTVVASNSASEEQPNTAEQTTTESQPEAQAQTQTQTDSDSEPDSTSDSGFSLVDVAAESASEQNANVSTSSFPPERAEFSLVDPNPDADVPGYKSSQDVPGLNTVLTRISSNSAHGVSNGSARHAYSRRQAWNANETYMLIGEKIIDASTYDIIVGAIPISSAVNWSNLNPQLMYGMRYKGGTLNTISSYNISNGSIDDLYEFSGYNSCTFGDGEGSISNDDRYVAISCTSSSSGNRHIIGFDIQNRQVVGEIQVGSGFNWASYSQSGQYMLVEDRNASTSTGSAIVRYDTNLQNGTIITEHRSHGDIGVDVNGDDVLVMISWDYISYVRLNDGKRVNLAVSNNVAPIAGHGHISCRNINRPGWCYFSSYDSSRVGAVKIGMAAGEPTYTDNDGLNVVEGLGVVEHWGFHRSSFSEYNSQPRASASPSGQKLVITSDWYGRGEINDYTLELKP